MRIAERDAHVNAVRAEHESRAAHDQQTAARHRQLARIWRALEAKAAREADMFAAVQETRRQWEAVTETTRRIAIAADLELRRRHPGMHDRAAPPAPRRGRQASPTPEQRGPVRDDVWIQDTLDGRPDISDNARATSRRTSRTGQAARHHGQLALGLTPETAHDEIPEQVLRIRENAAIAQAKLDELASTPLPSRRRRRPVTRTGLAGPSQGPTAMPCSSHRSPMWSPPRGSSSTTTRPNADAGHAEPERG